MAFQPPLDPGTIRNLSVVIRLFEEDPRYFLGTDYSNDVENLVRRLSRPATPAAPLPVTDPELDVLAEVQATYKELILYKPNYEDAAATQSYFRTRTNLLEKLLEQMERGRNQKQVSEFYSLVINTLEEICTSDQRTQLQEKLQAYAA